MSATAGEPEYLSRDVAEILSITGTLNTRASAQAGRRTRQAVACRRGELVRDLCAWPAFAATCAPHFEWYGGSQQRDKVELREREWEKDQDNHHGSAEAA